MIYNTTIKLLNNIKFYWQKIINYYDQFKYQFTK